MKISKKDALMLMGLQSTVFGLNGLPAFQAINQEPDDNRRRIVDRKARAAKVISGGSL